MRQRSLRFFFFSLFLCAFSSGISAQSYTVQIHSADNSGTSLPLKPPGPFPSGSSAYEFIRQIVPGLQRQGFLAASVDSMAINGNTYDVWIFTGKQYRWARVSFEAIPREVLLQAAVKREQWEGRILDPGQVSRVSEKLLQWAENNGYPFARVWLTNLAIDRAGAVSAGFVMEREAFQSLDSVAISGDLKVSRSFLLRYLGIQQGKAYNEKKLRSITARLRELPFLQESAPWTMAFKPGDNILSIHLKEKKANQLNALIGLAPNNSETGKFLLTVDALFAFQNILGQGESMSVSYQNLQYKSPRLKADLVYPYIFGTDLGIDLHFDLYKKDTSFRKTALQAGLRYQLSATDYIRVFYQNQGNRLITVDTAYVKAHRKLPDNIDVTAMGAGAETGISRTDYRLNPRRGWELRLSGSALARQVSRNDAITGLQDGSGFDYRSLYDTLTTRRYQYAVSGEIGYYLPLGRNTVFKSRYAGGWMDSRSLFRNELYQIGGFRLLRGFDEQSIFASQYHVISLELRLLLDQNSWFYIFSDNGYVVSSFSGFKKTDIYNGFGLGTTLETRSGLFSISYALGRNEANPVQLRQSKIHFGYAAYF